MSVDRATLREHPITYASCIHKTFRNNATPHEASARQQEGWEWKKGIRALIAGT